MDNKNVFASNLQRYMEQNGKTRRDISDALGISYFTVTAWVNGSKYPRMDKVELLANYFGILKSDLIEEKGEEQKEKPATDSELPESVNALIEVVKTLSEEDAALLLAALKAKQKR